MSSNASVTKLGNISVPEIYKSSADFRFFLKWFEYCLTKVEYDTENLDDLYDPLRCPSELLWMLGDTMGFKYDDRLPAAFNRLVLVYFMSMIRNKGSKDGVTLAAEANLAQFNILDYGKENDILYNRLEDTSIPVNSAYVTPHVNEGYIDVVYFSDRLPVDACIEYVRPLGMYLAQAAGVRYDARTKISVDPRLTDTANVGMSIGPTHVGHYSREDYARMQVLSRNDLAPDGSPDDERTYIDDVRYSYKYDPGTTLTRRESYQAEKQRRGRLELSHDRQLAWYRNSDYERSEYEDGDHPEGKTVDAGYRALYSLQLSNNEHIFSSLLPGLSDDEREKIFGIGYYPVSGSSYSVSSNNVLPDVSDDPDSKGVLRPWNLRYDETADTKNDISDIWVKDSSRGGSSIEPDPAVNPPMAQIGDAISMNQRNTQYIMKDGKLHDVKSDHTLDPDSSDSPVTDWEE